MKRDRWLVVAELVVGRELLRMVRRDLIDRDPRAVRMLMLEEAQFAGDRIARPQEIVGEALAPVRDNALRRWNRAV